MSKSSKLYADKGRIESDDSGPQAPQRRSEGPKVADTTRLLRAVLEAIGEPDDLSHVDLKQLHSSRHFRVNVYRNIKESVKMTDSYYVITNGNTIASSSPVMKKKYHDADLIKLFKTIS